MYADANKTDISQSVFEAGGTPGQVGAFYKVTFGNASVNPIYYDCSSSHTGEGGTINLTAAPASSANIPIPFIVGDKLAIKLRYDFTDSSGLNLVKSQPDSREYIAMLNIT